MRCIPTLREVVDADTLSIFKEKFNFNMDQIKACGGGPQGEQGEQGPQGIPGATGPIGPQGITGVDGNKFYFINQSINTNPFSVVNPDEHNEDNPRPEDYSIDTSGKIYKLIENQDGTVQWLFQFDIATIAFSTSEFMNKAVRSDVYGAPPYARNPDNTAAAGTSTESIFINTFLDGTSPKFRKLLIGTNIDYSSTVSYIPVGKPYTAYLTLGTYTNATSSPYLCFTKASDEYSQTSSDPISYQEIFKADIKGDVTFYPNNAGVVFETIDGVSFRTQDNSLTSGTYSTFQIEQKGGTKQFVIRNPKLAAGQGAFIYNAGEGMNDAGSSPSVPLVDDFATGNAATIAQTARAKTYGFGYTYTPGSTGIRKFFINSFSDDGNALGVSGYIEFTTNVFSVATYNRRNTSQLGNINLTHNSHELSNIVFSQSSTSAGIVINTSRNTITGTAPFNSQNIMSDVLSTTVVSGQPAFPVTHNLFRGKSYYTPTNQPRSQVLKRSFENYDLVEISSRYTKINGAYGHSAGRVAPTSSVYEFFALSGTTNAKEQNGMFKYDGVDTGFFFDIIALRPRLNGNNVTNIIELSTSPGVGEMYIPFLCNVFTGGSMIGQEIIISNPFNSGTTYYIMDFNGGNQYPFNKPSHGVVNSFPVISSGLSAAPGVGLYYFDPQASLTQLRSYLTAPTPGGLGLSSGSISSLQEILGAPTQPGIIDTSAGNFDWYFYQFNLQNGALRTSGATWTSDHRARMLRIHPGQHVVFKHLGFNELSITGTNAEYIP